MKAATPYGSDLGSIAAFHLRRLARGPRPTCSPQIADARQYCKHTLDSLGFRVEERPFEYSAAVGAYGTPAGGAFGLLVIGAAATLGARPLAAIAVLVGGLVAIVAGGRWLANRGVLSLPILRRRGVNLEACRGQGDPELWLVAHLDSKSQPIPLLVRAMGIVLLAIAWMTAIILAAAGVSGRAWTYVIALAVSGALPVLASVVGKRSAGAIDNASGVATALSVAALLPDALIGVLITDAEELGLAGARAWCAETTRRRAPVLNCDGVDDDGQLTLMWTRPRALRLERALREAAAGEAMPLRVIPLVPGVLVDAVAFSDAGWEVVTISRGSLATLRRVHTRGDSLDYLQGTGMVNAALVTGRAAMTLLG